MKLGTGKPNTPFNFGFSNQKSSHISRLNSQSSAGSEQTVKDTKKGEAQTDSSPKEALEDSVIVEMHDITGPEHEANQPTHSSEVSTPTDKKACKERGSFGLPQP